jgi:hypothetical protein
MGSRLHFGTASTSPCKGEVGAKRRVGAIRMVLSTPSLTLPLSGGGN